MQGSHEHKNKTVNCEPLLGTLSAERFQIIYHVYMDHSH